MQEVRTHMDTTEARDSKTLRSLQDAVLVRAIRTLFSKARRVGDCLEFTGSNLPRGYGRFCARGIPNYVYAHRASYVFTIGSIAKGLFVCHRCDNPRCIEPKHLWLGTTGDNTRDMIAKRRHKYGESNHWAKLTEKQAIEVIRLSKAGMKQEDIGARFGVIQQTVSLIVRGINWPHLQEKMVLPKYRIKETKKK